MADRGLLYEQVVRKSISDAASNISTLKMRPDTGGAYDATVVDIYLDVIKDNRFQKVGVEVKLDSKAQLGGTSVNYNMAERKFFLSEKAAKEIDPDTAEMILNAAKGTQKSLDKFLNFLREQEPTEYHSNIKGLPVNASKEAFEDAKKRGFLVPLNKRIRHTMRFVHDHYDHKKCYYMQIGNMGLFYLKKNPLKLPIPQLTGSIDVEMRFGRAGSRMNKEYGIKVAGGNYRIQGRLKVAGTFIGGKSPYSLDKKEDVIKLFKEIDRDD